MPSRSKKFTVPAEAVDHKWEEMGIPLYVRRSVLKNRGPNAVWYNFALVHVA